jgi:hypothetical protein
MRQKCNFNARLIVPLVGVPLRTNNQTDGRSIRLYI